MRFFLYIFILRLFDGPCSSGFRFISRASCLPLEYDCTLAYCVSFKAKSFVIWSRIALVVFSVGVESRPVFDPFSSFCFQGITVGSLSFSDRVNHLFLSHALSFLSLLALKNDLVRIFW